ncbi:cytochrome P450 [Amycolatopsis sp. NPDC058278]|uniref:cytochrome P450 n=1 Tax=Amycolatopsis sp. NPDC058278 TaxID=3346417 RepID=UPI0036DC4F34
MTELARNPHQGIMGIYRRFGPVCTLGVGPLRYTYMLGPEANRFVLANSQLFRWREAFQSLMAVDGENALIVSDGEQHQRLRRLVTPAFGQRRIRDYAATMRRHADAAIDSWRPGQVIDLYQQLGRVIRRSTIEILFGARLAADEPELGRLLEDALKVAHRQPPWQQLQRLGSPAWRRAIAGREVVAQRIITEIEHRRREPDVDGHDVLSALVAARDDDNSRLTDTEIVDQVISLIAAGYETTSAASAWAAYELLAEPDRWKQAREDSTDGTWRYLDGVVSETLRLHPPGAVIPRRAATAFDFHDTHVAASSTIVISPYVTHRLPELWEDPLRFEPLRWDPNRPGHRKPALHEYLPFGGGPHRCVGAVFATTELAVLLERVLARTELDLDTVDLRPVSLAMMRPQRGPFATVRTVE